MIVAFPAKAVEIIIILCKVWWLAFLHAWHDIDDVDIIIDELLWYTDQE